jgi:hypothetical protein
MMRASQFAPGEMFAPVLVQAYVALGCHEEAAEAARETLRLAIRHGMQLNVGVAHRHLAALALARAPSEFDDAAEHLEVSVKTLVAIGAEGELAQARIVAARMGEKTGRLAVARGNLAAAVAAVRRLDLPWVPADLPALRARLL